MNDVKTESRAAESEAQMSQQPEQQLVRVELGDRSYDIQIGSGVLSQVAGILAEKEKGREVALISNEIVYCLYGEALKADLTAAGFTVSEYVLPDGERYKSWDMAGQILSKMLEAGMHRDGIVIALGGGVIGDLAGFIASIYQRGIPFYQIPTSLLAMVDSSVGGKVAVNHTLGKNMIGSFYQPRHVFIDLDTLGTLPGRDWKSGLAEIIKYGVIRDPALFATLEENQRLLEIRDPEFFAGLIRRSCEIKGEIVAADEREGGVRAILNLGHTLAHGIEAITEYEYFRHGEAVAAGMEIIADFAAARGVLAAEERDRIVGLLTRLDMQYKLPKMPAAMFMDMLALDKKNQQGQLVLIVPEAIGCVRITGEFTSEDLRGWLVENGYLLES